VMPIAADCYRWAAKYQLAFHAIIRSVPRTSVQ
jgi:hypothetical protein